jgi:hypothetical protein
VYDDVRVYVFVFMTLYVLGNRYTILESEAGHGPREEPAGARAANGRHESDGGGRGGREEGGGGGRDCDGVLHDATAHSDSSSAGDNYGVTGDVTGDVTGRGGGGAVRDQESRVWVTAIFLVCLCVCVLCSVSVVNLGHAFKAFLVYLWFSATYRDVCVCAYRDVCVCSCLHVRMSIHVYPCMCARERERERERARTSS